MAETFRVKNLSEALKLAESFKLSGKYNLFRGQAQNWKVQSTLGRLNESSINEVKNKLIRLHAFFEAENPLKKYISNIDWFFAVAQHYGIPTSYIDFTSNIHVASFFATNSKSNILGEDSVIICLNEDDFINFVDLADAFFKKQNVIPPYITRINVDNLWRLQAQDGCFLFSPFVDIESYYDFDKIIFEYDKPCNKLKKDEIFPLHKSELEILLDQYFNKEERILGQKRLEQFSNIIKIPTINLSKLEIKEVIKNKKHHKSWSSKEFKSWQYPMEEEWIDKDFEKIIKINLFDNNPIEILTKDLKNQLQNAFDIINKKTRLKFEILSTPKINEKLTKTINDNCLLIWNGTRNLPYSIEEIINIICKYISLEIYFHKKNEIYSFSKEKLITLEMTNEYGSITRCHVSPNKLVSTFRDDLNLILNNELVENISPKILLYINIPNLVFDFHKLINLFKDELVLYQVLYNSENENPVIFFTPTQIKVCGYA